MGSQKENKSFFSILQKIGQSLMIPVSVLPAAGLMVALSRIVQQMSQDSAGVVTHPFLQTLGKVLFSAGLAIFEQLSVVFAVGVAIGFTGGAGVAALAAVAGYFTMMNVLKVMGEVRGLTLEINTGVFGGIVMGLIAARLYNRYYQTKLPAVLGFFAGKRLVPILTVSAATVLGLALSYIWPPIQDNIHAFGEYVMGAQLGPAFYAAGKRLLIPVGLHHVYYPPFLYEFGEFVTAAGQTLRGESTRYFAGDHSAGRFMASEFPMMLFGLPAAAFAMYLRAAPARRKAVGGVMLSAALTSIITGITEPIEFAFIFVAPFLFVFHVIAAFVCGVLINTFDIHLGYTFSASLIDFVLGYFNQKNSHYLFFVVGPIIALMYFGVFYWAIGRFDFKTPGRGDEALDNVDAVSASDKAREVLAALGGSANIRELDACITRLRLNVVDAAHVNQQRLKELGATGVMNAGGGNVQVVFGTQSDMLKEEIKSLLGSRVEVTAAPANTLASPMTGRLVSLDQVPDETFSQKMVGDGCAIDPTEGVVCAPADSEVVQLFKTNHAIGLLTREGLEILIHIGIDTVKMKGEGFRALVKQGDQVKKGQRLIEFDLEKVRAQAKSTITPILVTNMDAIKALKVQGTGDVKTGQTLLKFDV